MALTLTRKTKQNEISTYARINSIQNKRVINGAVSLPLSNDTLIVVEFWKDAATRTASKDKTADYISLEVITYKTGDVFSEVADAYTYLKTLSDFNGAVDC